MSEMNGTMANGTKNKFDKYFNIPVVFCDKLAIIKFYEMKNSPTKFLLGSDFCSNFKISMQCEENKWHITTEIATNSVTDVHSLDVKQKRQLANVVRKFNALCNGKLGKSNAFEHTIDTGDHIPIFQRAYPVSPPIEERMSKELDRMIALDVVEPSNSPWCQPLVLAKKKNGKDRLCINCQKLNSITKKSKYALPRIDRILSRLGKAKFISSIDLQDAFWQIPLDEASRPKTAFNVPGRGMWQFKVVPFGLTTAAQAMQRLMDSLFQDQGEFIYIDDIIVVSETFEEHLVALNRVFDKLKKAGLTVNIEKCVFCRPSLKYLGYIVDKHGLRTDPEKIECIANYQLPRTLKELRRFVGMATYYSRFIDKFAYMAAPLHELKKDKTRKLKWNDTAIRSFEQLKNAMIQAPVLNMPNFEQKFIIQCDASDYAVGAALVQKDEKTGNDKPIAFASRKLRGAELNYTTTEKECLAVVFAIEKFKQYVEGLQFEIITDHSALIWLLKQNDLKGRLARWILKLQQYDFEIKHIKGSQNIVPDTLSRMPIPEIALIQMDNVKDDSYEQLKEKIQKNPLKYDNYKIKNDAIFVKYHKTPDSSDFKYKLLVPKSKRIDVIKECHDNPMSAHFGAFKTTKRILQKYYWPGVSNDVKQYVKNCDVCNRSKTTTKQQFGKMGKFKTASRPWQVVSMDLMGPFVRSSKGNEYLFVICDYFTKMPILVPLRNAKAVKICEIVESQLFLEHSVPEVIVTDNGKQFISKEFKKLTESYGVKEIFFNCIYHPQNNPTERQNKTIGASMRSYIYDNHKHWDKYTKQIQVAMRTATNMVTGYTPFYLDRGREFITSGTDYMLFEIENDDTNKIEKKLTSLKELAKITSDIIHRMARAQKINKQKYDKNKTHMIFNVGDTVYHKNFVLSDSTKNFSAKLAPKYLKATVIEKISDLVYKLKNEKGDIKKFHIKDIKHI